MATKSSSTVSSSNKNTKKTKTKNKTKNKKRSRNTSRLSKSSKNKSNNNNNNNNKQPPSKKYRLNSTSATNSTTNNITNNPNPDHTNANPKFQSWAYDSGSIAWTCQYGIDDQKDVNHTKWWPVLLYPSWSHAMTHSGFFSSSDSSLPSTQKDAAEKNDSSELELSLVGCKRAVSFSHLSKNLVPAKVALGPQSTLQDGRRERVVVHYLGRDPSVFYSQRNVGRDHNHGSPHHSHHSQSHASNHTQPARWGAVHVSNLRPYNQSTCIDILTSSHHKLFLTKNKNKVHQNDHDTNDCIDFKWWNLLLDAIMEASIAMEKDTYQPESLLRQSHLNEILVPPRAEPQPHVSMKSSLSSSTLHTKPIKKVRVEDNTSREGHTTTTTTTTTTSNPDKPQDNHTPEFFDDWRTGGNTQTQSQSQSQTQRFSQALTLRKLPTLTITNNNNNNNTNNNSNINNSSTSLSNTTTNPTSSSSNASSPTTTTTQKDVHIVPPSEKKEKKNKESFIHDTSQALPSSSSSSQLQVHWSQPMTNTIDLQNNQPTDDDENKNEKVKQKTKTADELVSTITTLNHCKEQDLLTTGTQKEAPPTEDILTTEEELHKEEESSQDKFSSSPENNNICPDSIESNSIDVTQSPGKHSLAPEELVPSNPNEMQNHDETQIHLHTIVNVNQNVDTMEVHPSSPQKELFPTTTTTTTSSIQSESIQEKHVVDEEDKEMKMTTAPIMDFDKDEDQDATIVHDTTFSPNAAPKMDNLQSKTPPSTTTTTTTITTHGTENDTEMTIKSRIDDLDSNMINVDNKDIDVGKNKSTEDATDMNDLHSTPPFSTNMTEIDEKVECEHHVIEADTSTNSTKESTQLNASFEFLTQTI